jgi:hypothetical protein
MLTNNKEWKKKNNAIKANKTHIQSKKNHKQEFFKNKIK